MIQPKKYLVACDLQDHFLHILIHRSSRKYLQFRFKGQNFQFRTATFGLAVVPWLASSLSRPILAWARSLGIRVSAYLDDWLIMASSRELAIHHTHLVTQKLEELGWLINWKKSNLQPSQQLEHLGYKLDTTTMTAQLPGSKV